MPRLNIEALKQIVRKTLDSSPNPQNSTVTREKPAWENVPPISAEAQEASEAEYQRTLDRLYGERRGNHLVNERPARAGRLQDYLERLQMGAGNRLQNRASERWQIRNMRMG